MHYIIYNTLFIPYSYAYLCIHGPRGPHGVPWGGQAKKIGAAGRSSWGADFLGPGLPSGPMGPIGPMYA